MSTLRFPNPGSDFDKFVKTFQTLALNAIQRERFDLDDAVRILIDHSLVSSSGAIGTAALQRSTREDRSRDPLYNQLKMYTELYRMLGWIHPAGRKLDFRISPLGAQLAQTFGTSDPTGVGLIREGLISITFPNPNTTGKGVTNMRPFLQMLRFMKALDDYACRDELILGVYFLDDDTDPSAFGRQVRAVRALRGGSPADLDRALQRAAKTVVPNTASGASVVGATGGTEIQTNTLKNYTRFPLGAFKSPLINWAQPISLRGVYNRSMQFYKLTDEGKRFLAAHEALRDVRTRDIASFTADERAHFLVVGHYTMYERAGIDLAANGVDLQKYASGCPRILTALRVSDPRQVFYSPFQQADHQDIDRALSL